MVIIANNTALYVKVAKNLKFSSQEKIIHNYMYKLTKLTVVIILQHKHVSIH